MSTTSQAHSSRLLLAIVLCGGIVAGVLLTFALTERPRTEPAEVSASVDEQVALMAASVKALSEDLAQLGDRIDEAVVRLEQLPAPVVEQRIPVVQPADSEPVESGGRAEKSSTWITVLDEDIARVLVERGLTPFDPEVVPRVREAADALRLAEEECKQAIAVYADQLVHNEILVDEYSLLCKPLRGTEKSKRKAIIEQLATALDGLSE